MLVNRIIRSRVFPILLQIQKIEFLLIFSTDCENVMYDVWTTKAVKYQAAQMNLIVRTATQNKTQKYRKIESIRKIYEQNTLDTMKEIPHKK